MTASSNGVFPRVELVSRARLPTEIRAYALQEQGLDTVEANHALGFRDDERDYAVAAAMLRHLGVGSIELFTNNPNKVAQLRAGGVEVAARIPHEIEPGEHNRFYLETKRRRSGHLLSVPLTTPQSPFARVKSAS